MEFKLEQKSDVGENRVINVDRVKDLHKIYREKVAYGPYGI